jgi:hypothetical protein
VVADPQGRLPRRGAGIDQRQQLVAPGEKVRVLSQPDAGLYDALATVWAGQGSIPTVMAYLNAGDLWQPTALDVVLDVMETTGAQWVCGHLVTYNRAAQPTRVVLPFRFRRRLIASGMYGWRLPHIQQESTFWSGNLMEEVDLDALRSFRLAGDHYMWCCFARRTELHVVESLLGGFREHAGHLSSDTRAYREEAESVSRRARAWDHALASLDANLWRAPPRVKKLANPRFLLRYDHKAGAWR